MRQAVITGVGVIAPGGAGAGEFWSLLAAGRTATRGVTLLDPSPYRSRIAAEAEFDPARHGFTASEAERLDRAAKFALVAAREALEDSGLAGALRPERTGVALGSAVGCATRLSTEYAVVSDCGARWDVDHTKAVSHLFDYLVPSSLAAEVARDVMARGPVALVSNGCTSGLDALGHAADLIREGSADVVLAGGTEAPISPIIMACFDALKLTSASNDTPESASRPFDKSRSGFVLGEGCAVVVLEDLAHARRRGARIYAELAGFATRSSAYHMTGLLPGGRALAGAIVLALSEARTEAAAVDWVCAHGAATLQNDRYETEALKFALGASAPLIPVSSTKSMIGYALGATGALDIVAGALAMAHSLVPPTANLHHPDPHCDLDYTPLVARERQLDTVLCLASSFGGFHSAAVLTRPRVRDGA